MSARYYLPTLLLAAGVFADNAFAQQSYPFSQRGTVSQNVAYTELRVEYGRPIARGRTLFGDSGVVKWNQTWNPGADSATRITINHPIEIEGRQVAAGEYTLWLIPKQSGPWTFILSRAAHVFHTPYPGEQHDALRLEIAPQRGTHMETLAIYFPRVVGIEAEMRVHWGEMFIPVSIRSTYRPGGERQP